MSFSYDLLTDVGKVRLAIGDRVPNGGVRPDRANFSDEEITAILTEEANAINVTSARLVEILARKWAQMADFTLGPRKESLSQISKQYVQLATRLREQSGGNSLSATTGFVRRDGYDEAAGDDSGEFHDHRRPW
jgi:hypothetical protein